MKTETQLTLRSKEQQKIQTCRLFKVISRLLMRQYLSQSNRCENNILFIFKFRQSGLNSAYYC